MTSVSNFFYTNLANMLIINKLHNDYRLGCFVKLNKVIGLDEEQTVNI
ncbi:hypothetical protein Cycma_3311 [Cyclobacterium marinum DSM 745]|uniref:Uncharacterized protein n=1 Tax=Cyclobacterium marinum (strain ATCC 25205 / DSM 745 / LMG 13164 / NCIMB 1802) TaxID=880070 RepID=G0IV44_CYCMS|nr:hypothetical protein Cycma_3311 [Cyclobacterium marinum DSM 745]